MFRKDKIYNDTVTEPIDFSFDEKVASVFPDMVHRSIPGYTTLLTIMQAIFRERFKDCNNLLAYDLGCSVGGVILALSNSLPITTNFIGVDISKDMLNQCKKSIKISNISDRVTLVLEDITKIKIEKCDILTINFTLQFLAPEKRDELLFKCFNSLNKNGVLFISEKTLENKDIISWHEQFKKNNGYSELEIAQKRSAIENIMRVDDEKTILTRAKKAGFKNISQVFHALSFKAWVLEKS